MEKSIGRIWVSLAILAVATVIWLQGDALKVTETNLMKFRRNLRFHSWGY